MFGTLGCLNPELLDEFGDGCFGVASVFGGVGALMCSKNGVAYLT